MVKEYLKFSRSMRKLKSHFLYLARVVFSFIKYEMIGTTYFIQQKVIEHLLYAAGCSRYWSYTCFLKNPTFWWETINVRMTWWLEVSVLDTVVREDISGLTFEQRPE